MASGHHLQFSEFPRYCWCAIYTRQSREPNDEYSSCEAQSEACFEFIRSRFSEGWICNGRGYDDVAESSETLDRPGFQRRLQDIREGKVDRVVIRRLDRFSRRILDWTEFLQEFAAVSPRAQKYVGWPMLVVLILTRPETHVESENSYGTAQTGRSLG